MVRIINHPSELLCICIFYPVHHNILLFFLIWLNQVQLLSFLVNIAEFSLFL